MENDVIVVGNHFSDRSDSGAMGVRIINHVTSADVTRNKVIVQNYLFSFLIEGTKIVHTRHDSIRVTDDKFTLILSGNCLMTEKITSTAGRFESLLLFFNQEALDHFFTKYPQVNISPASKAIEQAYVFTRDPFLTNFVQSLALMFENGDGIPPMLQQLKFEELMLYLCYHYPEKVQPLKSRVMANMSHIELKRLIESNIGNNITLDELAFLSNMSLSTFKRKFINLYGMAPSKWFLKKRMELAMVLLKGGKEKPGEVYHKIGYESHSSFTHSFKQVFGITPSEFREKNLV